MQTIFGLKKFLSKCILNECFVNKCHWNKCHLRQCHLINAFLKQMLFEQNSDKCHSYKCHSNKHLSNKNFAAQELHLNSAQVKGRFRGKKSQSDPKKRNLDRLDKFDMFTKKENVDNLFLGSKINGDAEIL
jgi:hypothetical protein